MKALVTWFASNPVAANLLMLLIVAAGIASARSIRQETYPNVAFDFVSIGVQVPGAAPEEVEEGVCVRIEEAIRGVRDVERIFSRATEGFGGVWAQLAVGADARRVLEEIRTQVDALDTLPDEAETPVVQELIDDSILLSVVVHGEAGERVLRSVAEEVRDGLTALPQIDRAELAGVRDYEVSIELSEADLRRHGLRFDDVARAVRASSLDLAGGTLETPSGEILVRTRARALRGPDFERLVLLTREDGTRLYLGDVARVVDGFEQSHERVRFDGMPAAFVRLRTSERANVLDVSRAARDYVAEARERLPGGVRLGIWWDQSREFAGRRDLLLRNGVQGLALILLILALFLRFRLAVWVALGIPISFLGALVLMGASDVSVNMMSLFAFIVALGLVVDDAIIIGESVERHHRAGRVGVEGSVAGTLEVAMPVTIAVLTTIFFLLPAIALPTVIGKIARSLGIVVVACLVFSVIEALFVLPAHLRGSGRRTPPDAAGPGGRPGRALGRAQRAVDAATTRFVEQRYRPLLERALRRPGIALSIAVALLLVTLGTLAGAWVRSAFLPDIEHDFVSAELVMPPGTPPETMRAAAARLESAALELGAELAEDAPGGVVVEHTLVAIGEVPDRHDDFQDGGEPPNTATVRIGLVPGERRHVTSLEIADRWRERVRSIPGALSLAFSGSDMRDGPEIDVALHSGDRDTLAAAAAALADRLAAIPGARDVADSLRGGKRELHLSIRPEAEARGLTLAELARQVRQGFHGEEVQRVQRGRDDVAVVVRYPPEARRSLGDLDDVRIRLPDGSELPFAAVAESRIGRAPSVIERRDLAGTVSVSARIDRSVTSSDAVLAALTGQALPEVLSAHPGVRYTLDGDAREEAQLQSRLYRDWLLALLAAYVLLAVPLRSYAQPVLVLSALPFGLVGAIAGHAIWGLTFSAFSSIGLVALSGVVINDALVLIDCANRRRAEGLSFEAALVDAGTTRFRPILLTSLTTFFGLLPLLFERSAQAAWLKPMAVTLGFGVLFATGITLLLVPAAAILLEQAGAALRGLVVPRRAADAAVARPTTS